MRTLILVTKNSIKNEHGVAVAAFTPFEASERYARKRTFKNRHLLDLDDYIERVESGYTETDLRQFAIRKGLETRLAIGQWQVAEVDEDGRQRMVIKREDPKSPVKHDLAAIRAFLLDVPEVVALEPPSEPEPELEPQSVPTDQLFEGVEGQSDAGKETSDEALGNATDGPNPPTQVRRRKRGKA